MPDDKPELSSHELLRQAREEFAPPKLSTRVDTRVDGPSIQDLLAVPLSSESLLPQRAVDHWDPDEDDSSDTAWEQIEHSAAPTRARARRTDRNVSKRAYVAPVAQPGQPSMPGQPPVQWDEPDSSPPPWLEPIRDELGLPPAARTPPRPRPTRRPLGPPAQLPGRTKVPWRLIVAGVVGLLALIGAFTDDGTTSSATSTSSSSSSSEVGVGSCFNSTNFEPGAMVDCAQLHRVQIFALVGVSPDAGGTVNLCFNRAVELREGGTIPDDTVVPEGTFVGVVGASATNSARTFCYLESPSTDLVGSVFQE